MYGKSITVAGENFFISCVPSTSNKELIKRAWKQFEIKYLD